MPFKEDTWTRMEEENFCVYQKEKSKDVREKRIQDVEKWTQQICNGAHKLW